MTDAEKPEETKDAELLRAVWEEARDLVKRLEGSTVQRLRVEAGKYKIEIERLAAGGATTGCSGRGGRRRRGGRGSGRGRRPPSDRIAARRHLLPGASTWCEGVRGGG